MTKSTKANLTFNVVAVDYYDTDGKYMVTPRAYLIVLSPTGMPRKILLTELDILNMLSGCQDALEMFYATREANK